MKGLPKHVDAKRLREHFGEKGEVTDAKIVTAKCAHSRRNVRHCLLRSEGCDVLKY